MGEDGELSKSSIILVEFKIWERSLKILNMQIVKNMGIYSKKVGISKSSRGFQEHTSNSKKKVVASSKLGKIMEFQETAIPGKKACDFGKKKNYVFKKIGLILKNFRTFGKA